MGIVSKLKQNDTLAMVFRFFKWLKIRYIYKLKSVHSTFNIGGPCTISPDLIAGEYSYVGKNVLIYPGVSIGRYTMIAPNVQIIGSDHNYQQVGKPATFSGRPPLRRTKIGRDVWVGTNSIIMAGVELGDGCIVAAGSIVTKNIEPYCIVAGVPARLIRKRFQNEEQEMEHSKMLYGPLLENVRNKPIQLSEDEHESI